MAVVVNDNLVTHSFDVLTRTRCAKRPKARGDAQDTIQIGANRNDRPGDIVEWQSSCEVGCRGVWGRGRCLPFRHGATSNPKKLQSKGARTLHESTTVHAASILWHTRIEITENSNKGWKGLAGCRLSGRITGNPALIRFLGSPLPVRPVLQLHTNFICKHGQKTTLKQLFTLRAATSMDRVLTRVMPKSMRPLVRLRP